MSIEARVNPKIVEVIARVGRSATLERMPQSYDFRTNKRSDAPEATAAVTITPVFELRRSLADVETDATSYCLMAALGAPLVPTTACFLVVDGRRWKVVSVVAHSAGTAPTAYEMRLAGV